MLWNFPAAEIKELDCMCSSSKSAADNGIKYRSDSCVFEVKWQARASCLMRLKYFLFCKDLKVDHSLKSLEQNYRLLDRKNADLALRNDQLNKVREIALGIDSVKTVDEVYRLIVDLSIEIPGICFAMVQKLDETGKYLTTPYYSRTYRKGILAVLKVIGFDLENSQSTDSRTPLFLIPTTRLKMVFDYLQNPRIIEVDRLSNLLEGGWGDQLCDTIQRSANIKKIVIVPLLIDNRSEGSLLFFLDQEIPSDIFEMIGTHCSVALKNVITTEKLSESEEKMRLTIESLVEGIIVTSIEGIVLSANKAAARIHGYNSAKNILGENALRYVEHHDRRRLLDSLKKALKGETFKASEYTFIKKDGCRFAGECSISVYKNSSGKIEGFVICVRDISERKRKEILLQTSERRYRLIAENTNDFITIITRNGTFTYLSPSHRLLGYHPDELKGTPALDMVHPDDKAVLIEVFTRLNKISDEEIQRMKTSNYSQHLEYRVKDKEGHWHDFEITGNFIESPDNVGFNMLLVGHDVTARKQAENQLVQLFNSEKETREALEQEIKKRGDFFRALVHELKTPLTPIVASSETLKDLADNNISRSLAQNVYKGAIRLNRRVDELLDISKSELGLLKVDYEPVDLARLIEDTAGYIQSQLDLKQQTLTLELPDDLPLVMGDETRLRQVLINLLDNAMKFAPEKGLISISCFQDENNLVTEVNDNGPGIDESDQERLFQPYNRIESDRQHFSGLGLGLALCKQLIDLHGGKIWIESQKGRGSTFRFSLQAINNLFLPRKIPYNDQV